MNQARILIESYFKMTGSQPFPKLRIYNIPANLKKRIDEDSRLSDKLVGYDQATGQDIILVFSCPVKLHEVALALDLSLNDVMVYTAAQQGHHEPQFKNFSVVYIDNENQAFEEE